MEKMARPLSINPTFLPPTHGVLKSLLENPLKLPFHHHEGLVKVEKEKEIKKLDDESQPQSAFLGPTLWDKTLPYDGDNFQLEYMDLEEFLSENGIPANPSSQSEPSAPRPHPQAPSPQQDEEGEEGEMEGSVETEEALASSSSKTNHEEFEMGSEYSDRLPLGAEAVNISQEINGNYKDPSR